MKQVPVIVIFKGVVEINLGKLAKCIDDERSPQLVIVSDKPCEPIIKASICC